MLTFTERIHKWVTRPHVFRRILTFGVPEKHARALLSDFHKNSRTLLKDKPSVENDTTLTQLFMRWASSLSPTTKPGQSQTISQLVGLCKAADLSYPAETFSNARKLRRKFIMHVGPTNSGKTHNALQALCKSTTGVYAGPLRLLAHEIWERINLGTIAPSIPPRACNLITGEEQRVVDPDAPLVSCTVEMLPLTRRHQVAVIDEIQLIADPERGASWTTAILGCPADEIHLCGEETAVPIIEAILKDTGDELQVNRYQRLTPLVIEKESLKGDFGKIRKGDAVVAFSRSQIFAIKKDIEAKTGLRCAVAYGKLPPEIRSEQAALFNDPNSGYDVIVGSDAIGMGLNLKIKRVVFHTVSKWDGQQERYLSASQTKQIAGRAGRFGQHDANSDGYVTTLMAKDLPVLRALMETPITPLTNARIGFSSEQNLAIAQALPAGTDLKTVLSVYQYVSARRYPYMQQEVRRIDDLVAFVKQYAPQLDVAEQAQLAIAPIPWVSSRTVEVMGTYVQLALSKGYVNVSDAFHESPMYQTLLEIEEGMGDQANKKPVNHQVMQILEDMHKSIILYLWYALRNPVIYSQYTEAAELKQRVEAALEWSIEGISWVGQQIKTKRTTLKKRNKSKNTHSPASNPHLISSQAA